MVINHNLTAAFAARQESLNTSALQNSTEKLSSGEKINRAGDDAANLAVSEKMRSQIRGLNKASENAANAVSFIQTTEGWLQETTDIIQRIRELAVQSANGIYTDEDRMQIQVEVSQLVSEIDRIASTAQFNGMCMLTGRFAEDGIRFHIGANMDQNVEAKINAMDASSLGLKNGDSKLSLTTPEEANAALGTLDEALKLVNKQRADLGAYQNRLETAIKGLDIASENLSASESKIRDTDLAEKMVEYVKDQILEQTSLAFIAQANNQSQNVLTLLD
jgi:flagellin